MRPYYRQLGAVTENILAETVQIRYIRADQIVAVRERVVAEPPVVLVGVAEICKVYTGKRGIIENVGFGRIGYKFVRVVPERSE